jgi:selenocysteine lyase/cysteine desulfurase
MNPRRNFIKKAAAIASALSLGSISNKLMAENLQDAFLQLRASPLAEAIAEEDLWKQVQQAYTIDPNFINLNNGGVSPQPRVVQDTEIRKLQAANEIPSYYMWRVLIKDVEVVRERLARLAGCSAENIAINRNTTEGLHTVLMGQDWKEGDEIVVTKQDYSTVKVGWELLERRYKVKIIWLDLPTPLEDENLYVSTFLDAFSPKTKLVFLTQVINWTGQVMPISAIRKVCEEAKKRGIFSLVDGAHSFAQFDFKIPDLGCDAFATSLHKWLCAPFGTGMLYVRETALSQIWPLFPANVDEDDNIRKFEHLGTRSFAQISAISQAIDFHEMIGIQLKEARLRYLKDYWVNPLKNKERLIFHSSHKPEFSSVLTLFEIEGLEPIEVERVLYSKFYIHVTNSEVENIKGTRVSPNVYTRLSDLDRLMEGIDYLLKL